MKKEQKNPWKVASIILGIFCVCMIILNFYIDYVNEKDTIYLNGDDTISKKDLENFFKVINSSTIQVINLESNISYRFHDISNP